MFDNLSRFVNRSLLERDWLQQAIDADKRNRKFQARLTQWREKRNTGPTPRVGYCPRGRTIHILEKINPAIGYGECRKAYQAAIAEAVEVGLGTYLLPKIEAAYNAHKALCDQARTLSETGGGTGRLDLATPHCLAFNMLVDILNSHASKPAVPVVVKPEPAEEPVEVGTVRVRRGTKKSKTRKLDTAIVLVYQNPELNDAQIAEKVPCSRSYLSKNSVYQKNANMVRGSLRRLPNKGKHDRRTGQTHAITTDPEPED